MVDKMKEDLLHNVEKKIAKNMKEINIAYETINANMNKMLQKNSGSM